MSSRSALPMAPPPMAAPSRTPLSPGSQPVAGPAKPKRNILKTEITPKKVKSADLMNFSRQAAAFLRAGIPVLEALSVLADETKNKLLRKILVETDRKSIV